LFFSVDYKLEDGEWLHGKKEGLSGIFPASYAVELNNPSIVLHDFPAQEEGDLELWTNEVFLILSGRNALKNLMQLCSVKR